jgi:predicted ATPase with chaperone activity
LATLPIERTRLETPAAPESVADVGVRLSVLQDLALKILYLNGPLSMTELSARIRLGFGIVNEFVQRFRSEQLCEVTGMKGNIPQIAITTKGRTLAVELLAINQYAGPAPVSLQAYARQVQAQSVRDADIHPPEVERAFSHLVLEPRILRKLGSALNSGSSIFLYGPSGTGKTSIAVAFPRALSHHQVWVPYAVEVDGQIIVVHDPHVHVPIDREDEQSGDPRWVLCHRPTVLVGGELTLEMLELQLNPVAKFYAAPLQMKANNGVLIIDDFGRQRMRPEQLLNRWVVPLDRRVDFLTMAGGKQLEVPFEMFVVFATNLSPATLVDAAFLRRIQTKIEVGAVSDAQFHEIFRWVCDELKVSYEAAVVDELIDVIRNQLKEPLRACHPRDIVNQICWAARYESRLPILTHATLMAAIDAYFVPEIQELSDCKES